MTSTDFTTRTLRLRLKDRHAALLRAQAREVNFVWNYLNELSLKILEREGRFCSSAELDRYTAGAAKQGLSLHSQTVQAISKELVTRRRQFKKRRLAWRKSAGTRRSLGWIPVKASALRYRGGQVWYCGKPLSLWDSFGLQQYELGTGCFSEDSRGRWYLNVTVQRKQPPMSRETKAVGIDLGLKDFFATSDGLKVEAHRLHRDLEPAIAAAQRANKKQRVAALHAKVKARRKDALHKLSTGLVNEYSAIFIGNVNASALAQTRLAKSVLDAGWSAFRTMLQYKGADAGVWFEEVDEGYSTQTCSCCDSRTGPKGAAGLGIRTWRCEFCGTLHDRDVNAAKNILNKGMLARAVGTGLQGGPTSSSFAAGRGRLVEGIPAL
ncbi:RNA-guided endonuclease InsQ/TnpB family protein [Cupriavidus sp. 8B]